MLVKEYRIPLPLSLEEYRIAQLFMIQKKSRLESTGSDSSVEIIENTPYKDGPGGDGQYTKKIYHIGSHLPGWLKSLLPKTALRIEEEAWNAYPYTKTRYSCPFIDKFFIAIETHYLPDYGQTENIFKLSSSERKNTEVDLIDPVKDPFPPKDYKEDEDPHDFVSKKTGRGPLQDDWLEDYKKGVCDVMCAYKLIQVEFKYWGMQSKIENFIHSGLRNPMLVGHRQAWSWQDEWYGLTISDIRQLEKQAQLELSKRMAELTGEHSEPSNDHDVVSADEVDGEFNAAATMSAPKSDEFLITSEEHQLGIHMKHIEQSESDDEFEAEFFDALETLDDEDVISVESIKEARRRSVQAQLAENEMLINAECSEDTNATDSRVLIFVVQAGSIADNEIDVDGQLKELTTFKEVFYTASNKYYPGSANNISIELITCPSLSLQIMDQLRNIHCSSQSGGDTQKEEQTSFPFSLMPLLIMQSVDFKDIVIEMTRSMNNAYCQFVKNLDNEEKNNVEVFVLADCVGGLLVYHTLTQAKDSDEISICSELHIEEMNSGIPDFDFIVSGVFFLGSPIGLVAFNEMLARGKAPTRPHCGQIYNLFHPMDPLCYRLEPIISKKFNNLEPMSVPRHQGFPFSFDLQTNLAVLDGAASDPSVYSEDDEYSVTSDSDVRKISTKEEVHRVVSNETRKSAYIHLSFDSKWWGTKRIDYSLYCPQGLHQFPVSTLVHLCYNSYWESKDLITFMLWQILNEKYSKTSPLLFGEPDTPTCPTLTSCKWQKKRTSLKIKNMSPSHRANDAICVVGSPLMITGKFAYGPVAMVALTGETVDVYMKKLPNFSEWKLLGSDITDGNGRLIFTVPTTDLEAGVYSIRIIVRGDHSSADCNMAIVPPKSEAVVFSIDSSFLTSISLSGINPKIRGGAVDAVRHWQELGYFIIYVSSRLLFQKYQVMSWLSDHNFPLGIVSFCDTVSANYQKHKVTFLKSITEMEDITIHAAYGSARDIPVYLSALKLPDQRVFLIGKKSKAKKLESAQWITSGYAAHLNDLKTNQLSRRSNNNGVLFSVGNFKFVRRKMSKKKKGHSEDMTAVLEDDFEESKSTFTKTLSDDGTRHLNFKRFTLKKTKSNNPP